MLLQRNASLENERLESLKAKLQQDEAFISRKKEDLAVEFGSLQQQQFSLKQKQTELHDLTSSLSQREDSCNSKLMEIDARNASLEQRDLAQQRQFACMLFSNYSITLFTSDFAKGRGPCDRATKSEYIYSRGLLPF